MPRELYQQIKFISPNLYELRKIAATLGISTSSSDKVENVKTAEDELKILKEIYELTQQIQPHVPNVIATLGSLGVAIQRREEVHQPFLDKAGSGSFCRYYAARKVEKIVNVSGAGDSWTSGFISAMLMNCKEDICVSVGFAASKRGL